MCGCLYKCPILLPLVNVNVYPVLPFCNSNLKYKEAAPKRLKLSSRSSRKAKKFSVRIRVSRSNKTSDTNIAMDLPYGVDFVSVTGPSAKSTDVQVDELANTIYFMTSPSIKSKRGLSFKIQASMNMEWECFFLKTLLRTWTKSSPHRVTLLGARNGEFYRRCLQH